MMAFSHHRPAFHVLLITLVSVLFSGSVVEARTFSQSQIARRTQSLLTRQTKAQDFIAAAEQGKQLVNSFSELRAEIKKAKTPQEKAAAQKTHDDAVDQARVHLEKATANLYPGMDPVHALSARFMLGYVYLLQKRNLESAVLTGYVSDYKYTPQPTKNEEEEAEEKSRVAAIQGMRLQAADLRIGAFAQEYVAAPPNNRDVERSLFREACESLIAKFPESTSANGARVKLAGIYKEQKLYSRSAEEYVKIPESAFQYRDAQLRGGQGYWELVLHSDRVAGWEKLTEKEQRAKQKEFKDKAELHLNNGVAKFVAEMEAQEPEQRPKEPPSTVVLGKISLAQINIQNGKYKEAIQVLSDEKDPWSVTKAVEVADESKRPTSKTSVKRKQIASLVYRLLLRSYVGTGDTDAFQETMKTLEKIAGESDSAYITAIYRDVAEKVAKELELIDDEDRKAEVKTSFETLLEKFAEREQGQTYSGLLWVATTYTTFGEDEDVPEDAQPYFDKAAETYQLILDRAAKESNFLSPGRVLGIKLLLVDTKRAAKDYDGALKLLAEILAQKAAILEAQIAGAEILSEQAEANDDGKLHQQAIVGTSIGEGVKAPLWGWGKLAKQLQGLIDQRRNQEFSTTIWGWGEVALGRPQDRKGDASSQEKSQVLLNYEERHLEVRLKLVQARYNYAMSLAGEKKRTELSKAGLELRTFASITESMEPEVYDEFNSVYQNILKELGESAEPLSVGGQTGS